MAPKRETIMVLKVDLQCAGCHKKVKKVLCQFPHIRDQVYDDQQNTVTIRVVCCSPEKIRDKICIKGGKSIHSIEIKEPPKKRPPAPPQGGEKASKPPPPPPEANTAPEKPDKPPEKVVERPPPPQHVCCGPCFEGRSGGPCYERPQPQPQPQPPPQPQPQPPPQPQPQPKPVRMPGYPPAPWIYPVHVCCGPCFEGRPGGPCYQRPQPLPPPTPVRMPGYPPAPGIYPVGVCCGPCFEGRPGGPCYERPQPACDPCSYYGGGWNSRPGYCISRCDSFSEENPHACVIM